MSLRNYQHKLIEPIIYQGTADQFVVYAYFESILPKLNQGSIVILDNASYHKSEQLQKLFYQNKVALIFLPPYSPELNPIENLWGTIKQQLRNYYDYSLNLFDNLCNVVNHQSV
jgi:transposase